MRIKEIIKWYHNMCDTELNIDFLIHISLIGLLPIDSIASNYSLNELNNLLLKKDDDGDFIFNANEKYILKEKYKPIIEYFKSEENIDDEFKIVQDGDDLRLIRL